MTVYTRLWSDLEHDTKITILIRMHQSFEKEYTTEQIDTILQRYQQYLTYVSEWIDNEVPIACSIWWTTTILDTDMIYLDKFFVTVKQRGFGSQWFHKWYSSTAPGRRSLLLRTSLSLAHGFYRHCGLVFIGQHDHVYLTTDPSVITDQHIVSFFQLPRCFIDRPQTGCALVS